MKEIYYFIKIKRKKQKVCIIKDTILFLILFVMFIFDIKIFIYIVTYLNFITLKTPKILFSPPVLCLTFLFHSSILLYVYIVFMLMSHNQSIYAFRTTIEPKADPIKTTSPIFSKI